MYDIRSYSGIGVLVRNNELTISYYSNYHKGPVLYSTQYQRAVMSFNQTEQLVTKGIALLTWLYRGRNHE